MRRSVWLAVLLALAAGAMLVVRLAPPVAEGSAPASRLTLPLALGDWAGIEGAPLAALPADPSESLAVRRTYRLGTRTAYVSVAHFARQDRPERRISLRHIHPERDTIRIERTVLAVSLGDNGRSAARLPVAIVEGSPPAGRLLVAYWHQIGPDVYGNPYTYRLAMLSRLVLSREADALLVRIAVPLESREDASAALEGTRDLAPRVYAALHEALEPGR